jgi:hypothetical protein
MVGNDYSKRLLVRVVDLHFQTAPVLRGDKEGALVKLHLNMVLVGVGLLIAASASAQDRDRRNGSNEQQSRRYEDTAHHDSHEWNETETQAYRQYLQEHHRKYHDFAKANKREQADYWGWRHDHPDTDRR